MRGATENPRGMALLLVVVSMGVIGGMVSALAIYSVRSWEHGRLERLHIAGRAVADSARQYVELYSPQWRTGAVPEAINLNVDDLLPPGASGAVVLAFESPGGKRTCKISVAIRQGVLKFREGIAVQLD